MGHTSDETGINSRNDISALQPSLWRFPVGEMAEIR
jgi:hypothetical protein